MTDSHPLFNKTMEDRSNPRVPSTFVVGNRVVIELRSSTQRNQEKLNSLVDYLQNKRGILTLLDTSDIVYSVTGDIPLSHMVNKFNLTRENLNSLIKFTNKQFFEENLASRELLQISTRPINLKKYFGPLLKRIIEIRNLVRERNNEYFKNFIDIVVNEIMSRIEVAANNQNHLKYLQDVYTSFIFNTREMSAYMDELMSLINEDKIKSKIVGNSEKVIQSKFRKDWNVSIHLRVTISLTKAFQILERNLNLAFNRKEFSVDKCQMIKCFTDAINQELSIVSSDIRTIMCERQSYETFLKKRIGMEILLDTSVTGNHSHVGLYFYSNQTEASIPCPILTRPKMVTMVEATDTSINIKWKFKDDSQVTSYKVHYRRCVSSSDSGSSTTTANQYYSFDTDNKCLTANVTNIAPGEYIFIVQAQFNDVLGIPSHESEPISTLNYDALNDQSIYCPICHDETKNFALVPCGHVFGENCVRRLNRCPFCALVIERRLKLYNN